MRGGEFPDADKEALIPLDACYTTESEALGYAVENAEFLLDSLRNRLNEVYAEEEHAREQTAAQVLSRLTEEDLSSIKDPSIDDVHNSLIQRRPDIAPGQIRMLNGSDVYLQLQSRIYRTKSLLHNRF